MSNDSVHLRNARSLQEGLIREIARREELQNRVTQLERQLTMVTTAIQDLTQQLQVLRARSTTTGPTER